jgi:hypothetical protein
MDALPANRSWQTSCSHGTYQHEAITSRSRQLLMMGTWLPETCSATSRREKRIQMWHLVGFSYPHCYQYLNMAYALRHLVQIWRGRSFTNFTDKARNIEERKQNAELHGGSTIKMRMNKDPLDSVFMLRSMYIFKGKYTLTNNFSTASRMSIF